MKKRKKMHLLQGNIALSSTRKILSNLTEYIDFPGGSVVNNPPANVGDSGSMPWSRGAPEGGNGNPLKYSCLGNPMDRGAWWATVHGVTKSQT